jgi:hypothetical protein
MGIPGRSGNFFPVTMSFILKSASSRVFYTWFGIRSGFYYFCIADFISEHRK